MRKTSRRLLQYATLCGVLLFFYGCTELHGTRVATRMLQPTLALDERDGDPVALSTTRSVAVLPFDNQSGESSFSSTQFSQKLSSQLAAYGSVRVIFPQEVLRTLERLNEEIRQHNDTLYKLDLLGKDPAQERQARAEAGLSSTSTGENTTKELLNPVQKIEDAIRIGRILQVDAILMGTVTDFSPYYRPRLTVTVKAVLTGQGEAATKALRELTQMGVPQSLSDHRGVAWTRQQVFDTANGSTARDLYLFARDHHTEDRPFDTEIYLRDMDRYYEFVGATLGSRYLSARASAIREMIALGKKEAKRKKEEEEAILRQIQSLVGGTSPLPESARIVENNERDQHDRSWREDYSAQNQAAPVVEKSSSRSPSRNSEGETSTRRKPLSSFWR